jgi:hypothetical protein
MVIKPRCKKPVVMDTSRNPLMLRRSAPHSCLPLNLQEEPDVPDQAHHRQVVDDGRAPPKPDSLAILEHVVPSRMHRVRSLKGTDRSIEVKRARAVLAQLPAQGIDAAHAADTVVATWSAMEKALSPIIGQQGFAAIYKRSLQLTFAHHPCLSNVQDEVSQVADFSTLKIALTQKTAPSSMAASAALLAAFQDLLANLIGRSLTDRLLKSVWETTSNGRPAQENSP